MSLIKIPHVNGAFKIESKLALTLNAWIDSIYKYNQDLLVVFDGAEGAGKSTLMRQVGAYCQYYIKQRHGHDVPFDINNIKFDLDDYTKSAIELENKKAQIHDLDESRAVANRKRSTSKGNVGFTNYLSECRSAGHIHMIALPAYHDLDSYIAIWRCSFLINIEKYFKKTGEENGVPIYELILGEYRVFLNDTKLKAMYYHKMKYIYPKKPVFTGRFSNIAIVDEEAYEEKKREARAKRYSAESDEKNKPKEISKQDMAIRCKAKNPTWNNSEIARHLKINRQTVREALLSLNV
jgi:hypothetical protein